MPLKAGPAEIKAAVVGLSGTVISPDEAALFAEFSPLGIILFQRNIDSPGQVRNLIRNCRRALSGEDTLILVDQEGGRVARLAPPHWPKHPAAACIGALARLDLAAGERAAKLQGRILAGELRALDINVNCAPCLDLTHHDTHAAIGDRSFSDDPRIVTILGRALAEGLLAGAVLPVIKHLPGHGRARIDSHLQMPEISAAMETLRQSDFLPFRDLADMPMGMTGHLLFSAIDSENPATLSARIISDIVRDEIAFDGFLFSDDLCMRALSGGPGERARAALAAGVDCALHCSGILAETRDVLHSSPALSAAARIRLARALAHRRQPSETDVVAMTAERDILLGALWS